MSKRKIFWAVIFILGAIGLILRAFIPTLAIFTLPVWKWFLGALILYWLLSNVIGGHSLARHLDVFFPLACAYILFRPELAAWLNYPEDAISVWAVLLAAALLHVANHLILDNVAKPKKVTVIHGETGEADGGESSEAKNSNQFRSSVVYLDSLKASHYVMNRFGQQEVYFQNTDIVNGAETIELKVSNAFGQTVVHVPGNWAVINEVDNAMGSVTGQMRDTGVRTLHIVGTNRFGELQIDQN